MTVLAVVTEAPEFVGIVAALAVTIFIGFSYLLLAVASGTDEQPWERPAETEDDPFRPEPRPMVLVEGPPAPRLPTPAETAAAAFAASMNASLEPVALKVVARGGLRIGDRVLDGGTGRVISATPRLVTGFTPLVVDPASATLAIGRRLAPGAPIPGAEFATLPYPVAWCNVVVAVHTLEFAADPVGVLKEWRRVTRPDGRLSLSVPGPRTAVRLAATERVYASHQAGPQIHIPTRRQLTDWARSAGWRDVTVEADPAMTIEFPGPDVFHSWLETRPWSDPFAALSQAESESLERDLLRVIPRTADGKLRIPFGVLYLTARNPLVEPPVRRAPAPKQEAPATEPEPMPAQPKPEPRPKPAKPRAAKPEATKPEPIEPEPVTPSAAKRRTAKPKADEPPPEPQTPPPVRRSPRRRS